MNSQRLNRSILRLKVALAAALALAFADKVTAEPQKRERLFACTGVQNRTTAIGLPPMVGKPAEAQLLIKDESVVVNAIPDFPSEEMPIKIETEFRISFLYVEVREIYYSGTFNKVTGLLKLTDSRGQIPHWWAEYKCSPASKLVD